MTIPSATILWPPNYKIKTHRHAKRVKLKASKTHGLEIILPYYFNPDNIPYILEENKAWILKQMLKYPPISCPLPDTISFHLLNENWRVQYISSTARLEIIQRPDKEIVLIGDVQNTLRCKQKIICWIKEKAKKYLTASLNIISDITQLPYKALTIRQQTSRWGSCTSQQTISLNFKLIFLPASLVNHIMVHELCHIKHLNHSKQFWDLVATHDADWQKHRQALKYADQFIPNWL